MLSKTLYNSVVTDFPFNCAIGSTLSLFGAEDNMVLSFEIKSSVRILIQMRPYHIGYPIHGATIWFAFASGNSKGVEYDEGNWG